MQIVESTADSGWLVSNCLSIKPWNFMAVGEFSKIQRSNSVFFLTLHLGLRSVLNQLLWVLYCLFLLFCSLLNNNVH